LQIQEAVRKKGWAVQTDNVLDDLNAELKILNMANTVELDFLLTKVMEWLGNHALKLKS